MCFQSPIFLNFLIPQEEDILPWKQIWQKDDVWIVSIDMPGYDNFLSKKYIT